ncbi:LIC_10190 family membrane protein [Cesiribacter andamanensis]|uniref:DUF8201 domain-containing protein n=1 Tax=Cesiribacter andamanensis AMV16 TaxID=1279009 RepID=M7N3I8_9BACT|nr:hypothetical protein [Cesiribacter andamanensis]EMR01857.1 hypothetical protein ADICEAN_03016 [Cesiribacter andamanensis AMV16]
MLLILLAWLYILILSYLYGHALLGFFRYVSQEKSDVHFSIHLLAGLALLATFTSYLSLFISIGLLANLLLLGGAGIILLVDWRALRTSLGTYLQEIRQAPPAFYLFTALVVFIGLMLSAVPDTKYDEGLYYIQTIKWMEQYPAITGLGNLHAKLSFNSAWHTLSALFTFSFLGLSLYDLNGLFLLIISLYALGGLRKILSGKFSFSNFFRLVTLIPLHLLMENVLSPSPDFVIPFLIWTILALFITKLELRRLYQFDVNSLLILLLSVFAVTVKLSAAPILLLPLSLLVLQLVRGGKLMLPWSLLIVLFLTLPWFTRNVISSGYLVYPLYQLDLFAVDWKIPRELVALEVLETRSFAKIRQMRFEEVDKLSLHQWLPYWFSQLQPSEQGAALLNLLIAFCLPLYLYLSYYRGRLSQPVLGYGLLMLTVYGGILFWFFSAPHFRYGISFTLVLSLLCLSQVLLQLSRRYQLDLRFRLAQRTYRILPLLMLFFLVKPAYDAMRYYFKHPGYFLVTPGGLPEYTLQVVEQNELSVYVPEASAQCWDAPLPCAPFFVDGLQLRTESLRGGFRIDRANPDAYSSKRLESMRINGHDYNKLIYKPNAR